METNTLVYGEAIGQSAKDRAAERAPGVAGKDFIIARPVPYGEPGRWHAYVTKRSRLRDIFASEASAIAAHHAYKADEKARRATRAKRKAHRHIVIREHGDAFIVTHAKYWRSCPVLAGPFQTMMAAHEYAGSNSEALAKWKPSDPERAVVPVVLPPASIHPDVLLSRFHLRGVEFGVWEASRIGNLAQLTANALASLASALGLVDADIGLGDALAIALGARGHGKAAAHYEPERNVINITKTRGAGYLAHEWGHAFDYYCRNAAPRRLDGVRAAIVCCPAWKQASRLLDDGRAKPYWASEVEMIARSFECFVASRVDNSFLVSLAGMENTMPQGKEMERMNQAWADVFAVQS